MARKLRREQIPSGQPCRVHVYNRCAQKLSLLASEGEACKHFAMKRLHQLATHFALEIDSYDFMDNHFHLVVDIDPDQLEGLSDREVVVRWFAAHPPNGRPPSEALIERRLEDPEWVQQRRQRLADLSWFMKTFKQSLTQWMNRQMGTTGTAWEGRFGSRLVEDMADLIQTCAYVDLNPVVAGLVDDPTEAPFSSAFERKAMVEALDRGAITQTGAAQPDAAQSDAAFYFVGLPPLGDREPTPSFGGESGGVSERSRRPVLRGTSDRAYLDLLRGVARAHRGGAERAGEASVEAARELRESAEAQAARFGFQLDELREAITAMSQLPQFDMN